MNCLIIHDVLFPLIVKIQVGGENFAIGHAHEPVLLNISVALSNSETTEMSRGFPKTTTIGELKIFISSQAQIPLEEIKISRVDLQGLYTLLMAFILTQQQSHVSLYFLLNIQW